MSLQRDKSTVSRDTADSQQEVVTQYFLDQANSNNNHDENPTTAHSPTQPTSVHIPTYQHQPTRRRPRQRSLFDYLPQVYQLRFRNQDQQQNEPWGDSYKHKAKDTIRIWYSNPNGLGVNPVSTKSHNTFSFLHRHSHADVICLAETNLRWPNLQYNSRLNNRLISFYQTFTSIGSYNKHENLGKCQRGGICVITVHQIKYRCNRNGVDDTGLGRWS